MFANMLRLTRGQSTVDFIIGFAIFIIAFTFIITLIPELLSPYAVQEGPVVTDRAAATLEGDLLATQPVGTLNATCTGEFFNGSGTSCGFDASRSTTALLGLSDQYTVNATVEHNVTADSGTEIACYDGSGVVDCASGGTPLARGPSPPGDVRTVRSARRVVRIGNETLLLKLRVW